MSHIEIKSNRDNSLARVLKAVEHDEKKDVDRAFKLYVDAVTLMNRSFEHAGDPSLSEESKIHIRDQLKFYTRCWDRIKVIRKQQKSKQDVPTQKQVKRIEKKLALHTAHGSTPASRVEPPPIIIRPETATPPRRRSPRDDLTGGLRRPVGRVNQAQPQARRTSGGPVNQKDAPPANPAHIDLIARLDANPEAAQLDPAIRTSVLNECVSTSLNVSFDDIAGLTDVKAALNELVVLPTLKPEFFTGLRAPPKGLLVYGPPGNGKTMIAKALASETAATFFSISASSLVSKFVGESEKLMRALFTVANALQPSVIFIDEIDSILSARSSGEHEASRRLKTEFLVRMDGVVARDGVDRVVVLAATNRPMELDDAVLRRFPKRLLIPLPGTEGRAAVLNKMLKNQRHSLKDKDITHVASVADNYSCSDMAALAREAAFYSVREVPAARLKGLDAKDLRPLTVDDFTKAMGTVRPSTSGKVMQELEEWTKEYGAVAM